MRSYFEEKIAQCKDRKHALLAEYRADEAVFEEVRCNVYGIFQTIWNMDRGVPFFLEKLEAIPQNWKKALARAQEHHDVKAAVMETIKLETIREIRQALEDRT